MNLIKYNNFMDSYLVSLISANLLTLIIETPIYYIFIKDKRVLNIIIYLLFNIISNLTLNLIYIRFIDIEYLIYILEVIVFILEGLILYFLIDLLINKNKFIVKRLFYFILVSFMSNLFSFSLGSMINYFILKNLNENLNIILIFIYLIILIIELIGFTLYSLLKKKD